VCSWGAKSVISSRPFTQRTVRLISGRNNPEFSFGEIDKDDDGIGDLSIKLTWSGTKRVRMVDLMEGALDSTSGMWLN
jgi:hypothetical protein